MITCHPGCHVTKVGNGYIVELSRPEATDPQPPGEDIYKSGVHVFLTWPEVSDLLQDYFEKQSYGHP